MIPYDLTRIRACVLDVDGVLSYDKKPQADKRETARTVNNKDGYALQLAVRHGYEVGLITGAYTENIRRRFEHLGVKHIYLCSSVKIIDYEDFLRRTGLTDEQVAFAGDDIPDYEVMRRVGLPIAPSTAAPEIKRIARYISPLAGGDGIAREVIEQTMKVQGTWMSDKAFGW